MPETFAESVRIHRVTTRRRNLRALQCPLEPELLVAEFAGELPPEVTQAVREHIAVCQTCGMRSRTLRAPYELLASLGNEPVPYVPDLRDNVITNLRHGRAYRGLLRAASNLGRGGAIGLTGIIGLVVLAAFIAGGILFSVNAQSVARSTNTLTNVSPAGASGILLAQTDKLVTVQDGSGQQWHVGEVIAINEHSGTVLRSLPASDSALQAARPGQLPVAVAVAPDGKTIYEVTAPDAQHRQALVAFDATSGTLRFATPLTLPGGGTLTSGDAADALALAPNGLTAYVGLNDPAPEQANVRVLVLDAHTGAEQRALSPGLAQMIPMPPPPGSLPTSAFPTAIPQFGRAGFTVSLGAGGHLAVSPDSRWLFDVVMLSDAHGPEYGVVRRIDTQSGGTVQALALSGDFSLAELSESNPPQPPNTQPASTQVSQPATPQPQLYLVRGGSDAQCYVLDPGVTGPTLLGDVSLGGPLAPTNATFTGSVSLSPTPDGARLYIAQDAFASEGISGHDFWLVDTQSMNVIAHRIGSESADAVRSNGVGGPGAPTFIVRGGEIQLIASDLHGTPARWLSLGGNHNVLRLLATIG